MAPALPCLTRHQRVRIASAMACCRLVLVPWEFFRFNVLSAGSAQYGSHPWHWNATQGFPVVAATLLPLGLAGIAASRRRALLEPPVDLLGLLPYSVDIVSAFVPKEMQLLKSRVPAMLMRERLVLNGTLLQQFK